MALPLFPLSNVVLFPEARVPLHVFEPRYRQMMGAVLAGERILGMVTVLPEHHEAMRGNPPVFPVGCAGFVAAHQKLADGRYDLVLQGTRRFRILEEISPQGEILYRQAEVEWITDPPDAPPPDLLRGRREHVVEMLETLARRATGEDGADVQRERLDQLDDATFTNALCAAIGLSAVEKQGLLEANGVSERLERLESVLLFHVASVGGPGGEGAETVH